MKQVKITGISILFLISGLINLPAGGSHETGGTEDRHQENLSAYQEGKDYFPDKIDVKYAEGFTVEYHGHYKIVRVINPWQNADRSFEYVLVERGTPVPEGYSGAQIIQVPIKSVVTMSTTYITYLDMLGVLDTLVGIDSFSFVMNPKVRTMISEKKIKAVGSGPQMNIELAMELDPDVILAHAIGGDWDTFPKLMETGLKVAMNGEYMEPTPLGRFEWIKYVALFYNRERKANEIFSKTEQEYNRLKAVAGNSSSKPTVLVNSPYQGTWWIPGGQSFQARFIEDAGGDYIWKDDPSRGALMLDIESVFEKAGNADIWINPGMWNSLAQGTGEDERFSQFKAFRTGKIYNNNKIENSGGGNAYWETGLANPHIVLADLIKIFHPNLLPDHQLVYYKQLR